MKLISSSVDSIGGFKKWSTAFALPGNQDDDPAGGATPAAVRIPVAAEHIATPAEPAHRPWLMQGMRNAL